MAAFSALHAHPFLLKEACTALALSIDYGPLPSTTDAFQFHIFVVIGALLAIVSHTATGFVQTLAHHRHIAIDTLALSIGSISAEFPEFLGIAGLAVVGVPFTSEAGVITHLAGDCSGCSQQVEPIDAGTCCSDFLELLSCPAGQAVDVGA